MPLHKSYQGWQLIPVLAKYASGHISQRRRDMYTSSWGRKMAEYITLGICDHRMEISDGFLEWHSTETFCPHPTSAVVAFGRTFPQVMLLRGNPSLCYAIGISLHSNSWLHIILVLLLDVRNTLLHGRPEELLGHGDQLDWIDSQNKYTSSCLFQSPSL